MPGAAASWSAGAGGLVYEQWTNHLRKVVVKLVVTSRNQLRTLLD